MADTTRIMDLPENVTMQMNPNARGDGINTSYSPMDMHPNPYGHPPPSVPTMPTPSAPPKNNQGPPPTQQHLPSRDIPQDHQHLVQDPQVQPNYIPPVSENVYKTTEYMKQYDDVTEQKVRAHKQEKRSQSHMDNFVEQVQIPILVCLLFFIFHMPSVESFLFKHFNYLAILNTDGDYSLNGALLRSAFFGTIFYGITYAINTATAILV